MKTKDLLREIESLPMEERARVADSALKSLNQPESGIDKKWAAVTKRGLEDIKLGTVKPVSEEEAFGEIWKRFS